jgi:hypothetical protein
LFGGPIYSIAGPGDVSRMLLSHLLSWNYSFVASFFFPH